MRTLILLVLLSLMAGAQVPRPEGNQYPVSTWKFWRVQSEHLDLWSAPGEKVVGTVPRGALLRCQRMLVDKKGNTWLRVTYKGGPAVYARAATGSVDPDQSEPVQADASGDFHGRSEHVYWKVVDPTGLNGRWNAAIKPDSNDPLPDRNMPQWEVVTNFSPGTILEGFRGNLGVVFLETEDGKPWMQVRLGGDQACVVRANTKYIVPVDGP